MKETSVIHWFSSQYPHRLPFQKVDDQSKYAIYQSVFQILQSGNRPAILFKINSFGNHKYEKIEFEVIDLSFISGLIGDIFYFENTNTKNQDSYDDNESDSNEDENSDKNAENMQFKFKMNEFPFTEIMHSIMPKQNKILILYVMNQH